MHLSGIVFTFAGVTQVDLNHIFDQARDPTQTLRMGGLSFVLALLVALLSNPEEGIGGRKCYL